MSFLRRSLLSFLTLAILPCAAQAGVFNIPRFVMPGEFAIGFEPELTLSSGAGLGANLKYTQGLSELTNGQVILGTGGGPRKFRAGANLTFDFFPDIEKQPGIGISVQGLYYRLAQSGQFELTGIPYVHKTFASAGGEFEPFFSFPLGVAFSSGRYKALATVVLGSMFKASERLRYTVEIGVAVNNTDSYVSGGLVYYH